MATQLQTTVTPQFELSAGEQGRVSLRIENDPGAYADTDIHLILFPAVGAQLACDTGEVKFQGSDKHVDIGGGIAEFNGSDSSSIPAGPSENPEISVLYAFNADGAPVSPHVQLLSDGTLKSDMKFTGAVKYTPYKAAGRPIIYTPKTEPVGQGVSVTFGTIAAYYNGAQTTFQTSPFNSNEGNAEYELYRITSNSVTSTNPNGEFEKPPRYPTSGAYDDRSLVINTSVSLITERVHEIGYMDASGRGWVRKTHIPILEPYAGDSTYVPTKVVRTSPLGAQFPIELQLKAKAFIAARGLGKA